MKQDTREPSARTETPRVALFVTCLVDLFRPTVGFASLSLLQRAGCEVVVPAQQTCCGQPAYNSGDLNSVRPLAKQVIALLEEFDYVVIPSGSCAGMIRRHYPKLLTGRWRQRALAVAEKTYELTVFLHEVAPHNLPPLAAPLTESVVYHDGCAGLRELGVREQPRALLQSVCSTQIGELQQRDVCCGFGGTFCAKMPAISAKMADDKINDAIATQATVLCAGDLGCLLSLAGRAQREGKALQFRHVAELLDGRCSTPAIGEGS